MIYPLQVIVSLLHSIISIVNLANSITIATIAIATALIGGMVGAMTSVAIATS